MKRSAALRDKQAGTERMQPTPSETIPSVLGVRHLSKSFGPVAALKDVSLDISPGEIRGICGENGAGKSTLVKILTGVYRPDAGSVLVDGVPHIMLARAKRRSLGSPSWPRN